MWLLAVAVLAVVSVGVEAGGPDDCWKYYDHASHYKLDYVASSYPWDEVNQAMTQNPQLSQVLATGDRVPTSRPSGDHYYQPVSVVCPSERFMLKAFHVDGKECWLVKPEVQQVRYTKCSDKYNRDCHYCSYTQGGIGKCEEDYEWQQVWAYCKPTYVQLQPLPNPYPQPKPYISLPYVPDPKPYIAEPKPYIPEPKPYVHPQPYVPESKPYVPEPQPYVPELKPYNPQPQPYVPPKLTPYSPNAGHDSGNLFARKITAYDPWRSQQSGYGRRKRGVPSYPGKLEQISLYLPYQCSCKNFKC